MFNQYKFNQREYDAVDTSSPSNIVRLNQTETLEYPEMVSEGTGDTSLSNLSIDYTRFLEIDVVRRFVYKVVPPDTKDEQLDLYFKIFKMYNSLGSVNDSIESVKRLAAQRLQSFGIYDNQTNEQGQSVDPIFHDEDDLYKKSIDENGNVVTDKSKFIDIGTRGYVAQGARGPFKYRDGQFCIFMGASTL